MKKMLVAASHPKGMGAGAGVGGRGSSCSVVGSFCHVWRFKHDAKWKDIRASETFVSVRNTSG